MAMPLSEGRKLIITLEDEEVDLSFLAEYPCSTDRARLFGQLERTRLHYLIGEQDPLLGRMLTETVRFFMDQVASDHSADDDPTHQALVEEGQRRKNELRRFIARHYDLSRRA